MPWRINGHSIYRVKKNGKKSRRKTYRTKAGAKRKAHKRWKH